MRQGQRGEELPPRTNHIEIFSTRMDMNMVGMAAVQQSILLMTVPVSTMHDLELATASIPSVG